MDKIRIGNDIHIEWLIFRDNQPEVFEGKDVEVRLIHTRTRDVMPLDWVISEGVVSATFYGKDQINTGDYKLMLVENNGAPNMATIDECKAFTLVQCSCQEKKEEPSTSLQLHKVQLASSFALSGGGNINVEGYPNVDELEEVKELSGDENIIITDTEGNKKTTVGKLKEYVVKDVSELPPFRIFETETDYNAVKSELEDCVVCLRDTGVMLYHVHKEIEDGEEGGGEIEDKYIVFADPEVQRICAENWGDGVGITKAQVDGITDIGRNFDKNTNIISFNEFEKFTGVTALKNSSNSTVNGACAFSKCTSLEEISLPTRLTTIGSFSFAEDKVLKKVNIPNSVSAIGQNAFYKCTSLEIDDLNLPNLETLGQNAFYGVKIKKISDLGKITALPAASTSTQNFGDKSVLEESVLPTTLTTIPANNFYGYTKLTAVVLLATTPVSLENTNAFTNTNNCPIYVPDESVEAYKEATNWSTYADRIKGISELQTDNPELYEEIKDYLN